MGTEDWVLKGTKLISNTKKQRLKILTGGEIPKNTVLKKKERKQKTEKNKTIKPIKKQRKNSVMEIIKYVYMKFAIKITSFFFCKVIVGYKNEN